MRSQEAGLPLCMPQAKQLLGGLLWDLHPARIRALDFISIFYLPQHTEGNTQLHKNMLIDVPKDIEQWKMLSLRRGEVVEKLSSLIFPVAFVYVHVFTCLCVWLILCWCMHVYGCMCVLACVDGCFTVCLCVCVLCVDIMVEVLITWQGHIQTLPQTSGDSWCT